jgi:hypothetical protein
MKFRQIKFNYPACMSMASCTFCKASSKVSPPETQPSNRPLQKGMITIETDQFDCFLGLKLIKEKNEFHCF